MKLDTAAFSVSVENFSDSLTAEGIQAYGRYFGHFLLYYSTVLRERKIYGSSGCPFECPLHGKDIRYQQGLCPTAERVMQQMVTLPWSEMYDHDHIRKIAAGIEKVAKHYTK